MDAVLSATVAAGAIANPDNDPMTGAAEQAAGTVSVNPVLAGVAAIPPNLNPPPRDSPLVVVVTGVAPRVNPEPTMSLVSVIPDGTEEAAIVVPPGVNAGVGFTVAGAVVLSATGLKPCDGTDPKANPPA